MPRLPFIVFLLLGLLTLASCAEPAPQVRRTPEQGNVPPELRRQIDPGVTFADLYAAPASYVGRMVQIIGVVIRAKRTTDRTELEILQLPAQAAGPPTTERLRSEGRFLAVQSAFLDPAMVPAGTPITVVGTVTGSITRPLDESEYTYPIIEIKHLIEWNAVMGRGPGDAPWVVVERDYLSPEIQTVYIDPNTISREGTRVTVWQLTDYEIMQGTGAVINPYAFGRLYRYALAPHGFYSTTTQKQFDCAKQRVRLLAFTEFSHHMGTGRRNDGYVDQDHWLAVEPGTVNQALWELVCETPAPNP